MEGAEAKVNVEAKAESAVGKAEWIEFMLRGFFRALLREQGVATKPVLEKTEKDQTT